MPTTNEVMQEGIDPEAPILEGLARRAEMGTRSPEMDAKVRELGERAVSEMTLRRAPDADLVVATLRNFPARPNSSQN